MARVLILSSWVAHGHVGLCAGVPALQALGHTVTQLPTVMLSNHPGWPQVAGAPVPPECLYEMMAALAANGWLTEQDALLVGYLPTPAHVVVAADARIHPAPLRDGVPHGVGDVFAALIAAGVPLGMALGHLSALIDNSLHAPHLRIAETAATWTRAAPLTATEI
ncbi:hypothetical protein [Antarctobacter heliothermus]|uniref:pyridoxal kinase n=1 Tax=Antarctobacter heliothermus TaxID=74033 RepID=A0A239IVZ5_9RHOB|nr:hypothetical protein [Antarctobacter heliothermus]SNS97705.1 hypothetical protein SAMN04488078_104629 [Antarctobacter heliothermus]